MTNPRRIASLVVLLASSGCGSGSGVAGVPRLVVTDEVAPSEDRAVPFGPVAIGGAASRAVTLENRGDAPLHVGEVAGADGLAAPFGLTEEACSGSTLGPGATCVLTLRFEPDSAGAAADTFDVPSDDPLGAVLVSLSGTGISFAVAKTGQVVSHDPGGRDDGALRSGRAWPEPRFEENPDATITDLLTGLTWAKDAQVMNARDPGYDGDGDADGNVTWQHALDYVAKLNAEAFLGHADWRLPDIRELRSLASYGAPDGASWLVEQGFEHVFAYGYWSSTTDQGHPADAWCLWLWSGQVMRHSKIDANGNFAMVWPVRGVATGLASTGQVECFGSDGEGLPCTGTGQDGGVPSGLAWPEPRFESAAEGTLRDHLTGLTWVADVGASGAVACPGAGATFTWGDALAHVSCLGAEAYLGHADWRLPNVNELESLLHFGSSPPTSWLEAQGFAGIPWCGWTSTTRADTATRAYAIDLQHLGSDVIWGPTKDQHCGAMLVRGPGAQIPQ